jgi:LPXTG-motif cell wall-anchored protein
MSLKLYRPTPDGGLEPSPVEGRDYRTLLRSRRWKAAALANPDTQKSNPWIVVLGIALLAGGTFAVLVLGYWTGFWG